MKEYMMVFLGADYGNVGLSPEETQNRMGKWFAWTDKLGKADVYTGGNALLPTGKRVTGKEKLVVDSPSVESKELIGGYFVVKANSVDEVVKLADDYPDYDIGGTVEIREIMVFE